MHFKIKEKPSHTVTKIRPPTDEANKKKVADTLTDKIVEKVYPNYRKYFSSKMSNSKWEILLLLAIQSEPIGEGRVQSLQPHEIYNDEDPHADYLGF